MQKTHQLLIALKSANAKLGDVVATYRPVGETCPQSCSLLNNGCYAQRSFTALQSKRSKDRDDVIETILKGKRRIIRWNVSGDAFRDDKLDVEFVQQVVDFHKEHQEFKGWMYTHRIQDWDKAGFVSSSIPENLQVIASVDTEQDIQYCIKNGWKYATVTQEYDKKLVNGEVWCPIDKQKHNGKSWDDVSLTCQSCELCWHKDHKAKNIVFSQHTGKENLIKISVQKKIAKKKEVK
jgi:hypothetical protein